MGDHGGEMDINELSTNATGTNTGTNTPPLPATSTASTTANRDFDNSVISALDAVSSSRKALMVAQKSLQNSKERRDRDVAMLQREIDRLHAVIKKNNDELIDKNNIIIELKRAHDALGERVISIEHSAKLHYAKSLEEADTNISMLRAFKESAESELIELRRVNEAYSGDVTRLRDSLLILNTKNNELESNLSDALKERDGLRQELDRYTEIYRKTAHSVDEVALLEEEKNRTTISWLEEQEKNKQHMHTIATLQHKVNDLEREIEMMVKGPDRTTASCQTNVDITDNDVDTSTGPSVTTTSQGGNAEAMLQTMSLSLQHVQHVADTLIGHIKAPGSAPNMATIKSDADTMDAALFSLQKQFVILKDVVRANELEYRNMTNRAHVVMDELLLSTRSYQQQQPQSPTDNLNQSVSRMSRNHDRLSQLESTIFSWDNRRRRP